MKNFGSPLRYPGGKQQISRFVKTILTTNNLEDGIYIEPYAGGAGVALELLFSEYVRQIYLNDLDVNIYSFWWSVLNETDALVDRLMHTDATIENWHKQKNIFNGQSPSSIIEKGFATLFMNRCNRSGILNAGPIGGFAQNGDWKVDARYYKNDLATRIERIGRYRNRIFLSNLDCLDFCMHIKPILNESEKAFIYLDPPYYQKGSQLYLNAYKPEDHAGVSEFIRREFKKYKWMISYDACQPIAELYQDYRCSYKVLNYSVTTTSKKGTEFLFFSDHLILPNEIELIDPSSKSYTDAN